MKLKDLTPKGIKLNEAKMTPAKVQKIQKELVTTIDLLKKNFPMYKAAKDSGDAKKLDKHRDIAVKLTKKKKDLEAELDSALGGLYQDAELELKEAEKELDYQAPPDADKDDIKIDPDTDFKVDLKHLIDKHMVKETSINERPITRSKVDYSTANLVSNIDIKWTSTDDMKSDLSQWVSAVLGASGSQTAREIGLALKEMGVKIIKDGDVDGEDRPAGAASRFD